MPIIESKFRCAWWLPGNHAQTIWPSFFRYRYLPSHTLERVELSDGDFIDLVWSGPADGRIVLLLHGLEGNWKSHYVGGITRQLIGQGFRVCFMHFRDCSNEPNRLVTSYHSGKTDDPQQILEHIQTNKNKQVYAAIGISLGGNVLLKWLGEQGDQSQLQKAVAVSVPFQLEHAAQRMTQGLSRIYQRYLISRLQKKYQQKFSRMQSPLKVDVDKLTTFHQFDHQVTAPLHGFNGVEDYYSRSSSRQFIAKIKVPTLILHARQDPFMFPDSAPTIDELPENVWLEIPEQGGHVGFISGWLPGWANYWGEKRIACWLAEK